MRPVVWVSRGCLRVASCGRKTGIGIIMHFVVSCIAGDFTDCFLSFDSYSKQKIVF